MTHHLRTKLFSYFLSHCGINFAFEFFYKLLILYVKYIGSECFSLDIGVRTGNINWIFKWETIEFMFYYHKQFVIEDEHFLLDFLFVSSLPLFYYYYLIFEWCSSIYKNYFHLIENLKSIKYKIRYQTMKIIILLCLLFMPDRIRSSTFMIK